MSNDSRPAKCLVMFSGGLDSVIAVHLLTSQGLDVTALHFVLPFDSRLGRSHKTIKEYAEALEVPLLIVEEGEEFLGMVKNPRFGYGKHANPCIDCRIHRLEKAAQIMEDLGAAFLATGEVIGQRPMSQRLQCLQSIEKRSGLKGKLLRPLSALKLEETIPEKEGIVDRSRLMGISGRGRKDQLAYAREHGLKHATPAGGCILTQEATAARFTDLRDHEPHFGFQDFQLLAYGRHFRLGEHTRLVVGRNHYDNLTLDQLVTDDDIKLQMANCEGPLGIITGVAAPESVKTGAAILARYSKQRGEVSAKVTARHQGQEQVIEVAPATDEICEERRIQSV